MINVAIHSVPRSGSSWLGSLFDSHPNVAYSFQPLFSFAFKEALGANSSNPEIIDFFKAIAQSKDAFIRQTLSKKSGSYPIFNKSEKPTHSVYKEVRYHSILQNLLESTQCKVIGLIRDPRDTLSSWWNAPKEFRYDLDWTIEDEWFNAEKKNKGRPEEYNGFIKWVEVARLFLDLKERFPERFKLVQYEQILNDPERELNDLYAFTGLSMVDQVLEYLGNKNTESSQLDSYSVGRWRSESRNKTELPETISEAIKEATSIAGLTQFLKQ